MKTREKPIIHYMPQRSPEWFEIRKGKFTGTSFTTVANGQKATRETICLKKASEIITGKYSEKDFKSASMQRGVELEPDAIFYFELETGLKIDQVGFCEFNKYAGVSPDGLIGDYAGCEVKCPDDHTHLSYLLYGCNKYKWQIQSSLFVTDREVWYFVSYNANFPPNQRLFIKEHKPDPDSFGKIEAGLKASIDTIESILNEHNQRFKKEIWEEYTATQRRC